MGMSEAVMNRGDEQFENYLREFEPRRPGALRGTPESWPQWPRFAAAAAVIIVIGASAWSARRPQKTNRGQFVAQILAQAKPEQKHVTLSSLSRLAEQPGQLGSVLTNASGRELPDFREKTSALRFLTKE